MPAQSNLSQQMRTGALWSYLQGGFGSAIQFGSGIILARLLQPDDFGVFFAVTAYTVLLTSQIKFGIPEALLQASELKEEQWNSAFWIMQAVALAAMILVFFGAPFLADFYDDQRYVGIAWALALSFPVIPFMSINGTLLRRHMDFKTASIIQLKSGFLGTMASLLAALLGFGPYCFVIGGITGTLLSSYMMYKAAPWHPSRAFRLASFRKLFDYAWRIHLNNSIFTLTSRVDSMILGKLVGLSGLGLFMRARSLAALPSTNLITPIYQLAFSGFSRIQHDHEYTLSMYQKVLCAATSAVYPILLLFILIGDSLIYYLYGEKWLPAALPMRILTIGFFFSVITVITSTMAEAHNLVARQTPIEITNLVLTILSIVIGAKWGLAGIAVGFAIKMSIIKYLTLRLVKRSHLSIYGTHVLDAAAPALISVLVALAGGVAMSAWLETLHVSRIDLLFVLLVGGVTTLLYGLSWLALALWKKDNPFLQANLELASGALDKLLHLHRSPATSSEEP